MVNDKVYAPVAANSGRIGVFNHGFTYSGNTHCSEYEPGQDSQFGKMGIAVGNVHGLSDEGK